MTNVLVNKIILLAFMLAMMGMARAQVSGTFTVGPGADYETIADAFVGLDAAGGLDGDAILELQSDYNSSDDVSVTYVTGYQNYSVTIRPASDATDIQLDHNIQFNSSRNIILDGANPSNGNKVVQLNGEIELRANGSDLTIKNLKINLQGLNGIVWTQSNGYYCNNVTISQNEFFTESPLAVSGHIYVINSYPYTNPQSRWPDNVVVESNKFYGIENTTSASAITYIRVRSGLYAHNNSIVHTFSEFLTYARGISHTFQHGEAINNTLHFEGGNTSTPGRVIALDFAAGTGGNGSVINNIVSIKSSSDASVTKKGVQVNNQYTYSNNHVYIFDDGVSTAQHINSYDLEGSLTFDPTLTISEPFFTDPSTADLSLTGSALTNPDFRSTNNGTGVTTDHNGDLKHSTVPSKGAFEALNMIADITSFSHANEYVSEVIDRENSTVLLEVTNGTDLSNIGPSIGTYQGASVSPTSGTVRDFSSPKDYTVTAEDGATADVWTATIVLQNDAPTDIAINDMTVDENSSIGTLIGTLSSIDVDGSDAHSYDLVMGTGGDNNGDFRINGSNLESDIVFDYETKNSYSIRVRSDDNVAHGGTFEKVFTITVNDLPDEAPTAIYLDNDEVVEGAPVGTVVGLLSTEDIDVVDDHEYTLVSGTGDTGNEFFDIVDDQLVTTTSFDFTDGGSYSVLIRTTDNGDAFFEQSFTINIKEVNDGPQGSAASSEDIITPIISYNGDQFGDEIAISNGYAIIGARYHNYDENEENWVRDAGTAYVFELDESGSWNQTQKLVRPTNRTSYDNFGSILAMDGDYAAFGLTGAEGTTTGYDDGVVFIYEKNESGIWEYKQELTPSGSMDDGIEFGYDIAISGNYLVSTALYDSYDENNENYVSEVGAAYIFERNESGVWEEVQKIVASDRETYGYYYGESVAISGGYIAVGATEASTLAEDGITTLEGTGAIYMYERNESGEWNEVAKLAASDREEYEYLGYYIDIEGDIMVAGNYEKNNYTGVTYVFERIGGTWTETSNLTPENSFEDQEFGRTVAVSDGNLAIGVNYADESATGGGVYIFTRSGEEWLLGDVITPSEYEVNSNFGEKVALDGKDLIVADYNANNYAGASYIFELCTNPDLPTIEASSNLICDGTTLTLSIGDASLNDALSWEWYSESCGGTPIGSGASIEITPSTTTTYYVRGEGACSNSTTCSFITIEVYEECPEANIIAFSLTEQTGEATIDTENFTVDLEVVLGTNLTSLTPSVTVSPGADYSPQGAQDFTSSVIFTVTAEDGETTQDWEVTITEAPNSSPTVANPLSDTEEAEGFGTVEISYAGVFTDPDGDNLNVSASSSSEGVVTAEVIVGNQIRITEVGTGTSTITLTADDGNGGSVSESFSFTVTEAPLGLANVEVKIYPNPSSDFIHVESKESVSATLIDLNGKRLLTKSGSQLEMNIQSFKSGVYILQLTNGSSSVQHRIIKAN